MFLCWAELVTGTLPAEVLFIACVTLCHWVVIGGVHACFVEKALVSPSVFATIGGFHSVSSLLTLCTGHWNCDKEGPG